MSRTVILVAVAALVLPGAAVLAKKAPPDPTGDWVGPLAQTLKVQKEGKVTDDAILSVTVGSGVWNSDDGENAYSGTWVAAGKKFIFTYGAAGKSDLAKTLAGWIEEVAADEGVTIDVSVAFTKMKATAKVRDSKKKGRALTLKEKYKFTATATGDVNETRKGSFKTKGVLLPD